MTANKLVTGVRSLNPADKRLLLAFFATSILALALGIFYGAMTAAGRTGLFAIEEATSYKVLGIHGVTIFFYGLSLVDAGFVLWDAIPGGQYGTARPERAAKADPISSGWLLHSELATSGVE